MTKREKSWCEAYFNSTDRSVFDVYDRPSQAKIDAEKWIKDFMYRENGYDFRIISFNTFGFTCGFQCKGWNNENLLRIDTKDNYYYIDLDEYEASLVA